MKSRRPWVVVLIALVSPAVSLGQQEVASYSDPTLGIFALRVGPIGDVSGDGVTDLGVASFNQIVTQGERYEVRSGADGSVIHEVPVGTNHGITATAPAGDVNNDGVADFLILDESQLGREVLVMSGATFTPLHTYFRSVDLFVFDSFGSILCGGSDLDADGHDDFYINDPFHNLGRIYSGATGQVLHTLIDTTTPRLTTDVNADGHEDFVILEGGVVSWHSGADASAIRSASGMGPNSVGKTLGITDRNNDGVEEILAWSSGPDTGRIYVLDGATGGVQDSMEPLTVAPSFGPGMNRAGDMNGDGFEDFIVVGGTGADNRDRFLLICGRELDLLYIWEADESVNLGLVTALGDVNGDGLGEMAFRIQDSARRISVRAGNDLFLHAPDLAVLNEQVTLRTAGGHPGGLTALYLVEVNGTPFVYRLLPVAFLDAVGASEVLLPLPLANIELGFQAFALDSANHIDASTVESITVE